MVKHLKKEKLCFVLFGLLIVWWSFGVYKYYRWNSSSDEVPKDLPLDPCVDYYNYACREVNQAWFEGLQEYESNVISALSEQNNETMMESVTEGELNAHAYYNSCFMQQKDWIYTSREDETLKALVERLGGWSLFDTKNQSKDQWSSRKLEQFHHEHQTFGLFSLSSEMDLKNSTKFILTISPSSCFFDKGIVISEDEVDAKVDSLMNSLISLYGIQNETRQALKDVIMFDGMLKNMTAAKSKSPRHVKPLKDYYNPMTLEDLQKTLPQISWISYIKHALQNNPSLASTIDGNYTINVDDKEFFYGLSHLLNFTMNSIGGGTTIQDYFVLCSIGSISYEIAHPDFDFRGSTKELCLAKIQELCVKETTELFPASVVKLTNRKFPMDPFVYNQVELMIQNVVDAFQRNLLKLEWVDDEMRLYAAKKVDQSTWKIGFTQGHDSYNHLELQLNSSDYLFNLIQIEKQEFENGMKNLGKRFEVTDVDNEIYESASAWNHISPNRIQLQDFTLRPPFFNLYSWGSLNYGSLGAILGHEVIHSVGVRGLQVDLNGNLNDSFFERFYNQSSCFLDQYVEYHVGLGYSDTLELLEEAKFRMDENIAESAGLRTAYYANKAAYKDTRELPLPFWNPSVLQDQAFFLSHARATCSSQSYKCHDKTDEHSPPEYNMNTALMNFDKFSEAYNCPVRSRMNPRRKCIVW